MLFPAVIRVVYHNYYLDFALFLHYASWGYLLDKLRMSKFRAQPINYLFVSRAGPATAQRNLTVLSIKKGLKMML